jgi:ABC-type transport system involved in multi-copper enzyme maturation permease subunit
MGPLLLKSSIGQFEIVGFVARLFSTALPVLDHFNIQAAVATGLAVPLTYLVWAAVYCLLYGSVALVLALLLFEDRDLA